MYFPENLKTLKCKCQLFKNFKISRDDFPENLSVPKKYPEFFQAPLFRIREWCSWPPYSCARPKRAQLVIRGCLLPQRRGVPGVGLKTVVFACFPGLVPPRGRETPTLCTWLLPLDCFSTVRPRFPGEARVLYTAPGASFQRPPQFNVYSILMRDMAILKDGPFL